MILISPSLVIATSVRNLPRLYYRNVVTAAVLSADEEAESEPASNAANPATYLKWRGTSTAEQHLTVTLAAARNADYIAIAGHNLGTTGSTVTFETSADGATWTAAGDPVQPPDDTAIVQEFVSTFTRFYRVKMSGGSEPPAIGVIYVGEKLVMQRGVYVGHTPITMGNNVTVSTGRSESGQFLGRVVRRVARSTTVQMKNITPAWYRANMEPFELAARALPFFWAWRPSTYPREVGYAWLTGDLIPVNQRPNGMMQFTLAMQAHA